MTPAPGGCPAYSQFFKHVLHERPPVPTFLPLTNGGLISVIRLFAGWLLGFLFDHLATGVKGDPLLSLCANHHRFDYRYIDIMV